MDDIANLQEPDELRPAKRMRLDAPLAVTEETQEEMVDDDDWDDVYDTSEPSKTDAAVPHSETTTSEPTLGQRPSSDSTLNAITDPAQSTQTESDRIPEKQKPTNSGIPPEAMAEDPELMPDAPALDSPTGASQTILEQTSNVVKQTEQEIHPAEAAATTSAEVIADSTDRTSAPVEAERAPPKPRDDPEFIAAARAQKQTENAEWQFDSSDAESSDSDSTDSDDDSDSDSDSEGGYELLDPATAAKMLMSGDDEDGDGDKGKKGGTEYQPRTTNEIKEAVVAKPDIIITPDMQITHLGIVERTVENMILIKGATPGEYQVLESGSVLCDENRTVIGAVAETFGRVQEPMYSVAFTNEQEIAEAGIEVGTKISYVDAHSTFVFTQPLRNLKGTDASNIHDEEVGEDEMEFSDDEAEAEYKRQRKLNKKAGRGDLSRGAFTERQRTGTTHDYSADHGHRGYNDAPTQEYGDGLSYDDTEQNGDEFYQPLKRPENLGTLMSGKPQPQRAHASTSDRGRGRGRGDFRGRGRGDRGRGRGGSDRGGYDGGGARGGRSGPPGHQQPASGHKGSAHSFPDRHNSSSNSSGNPRDRPQHSLPPRPQPSANSLALPQSHPGQSPAQPYQYSPAAQPQQHHHPPVGQYQQPHPQPPPQQYQFNGYTFQYGQPPVATTQYPTYGGAPQQTSYYGQTPQTHTPISAIPPGAHVNPAFYPQYAQVQHPNPQAAWGTQPAAQQQFTPNTNHPPNPNSNSAQTNVQNIDLGDILKRLSNGARK